MLKTPPSYYQNVVKKYVTELVSDPSAPLNDEEFLMAIDVAICALWRAGLLKEGK